jgi:transcriptional regulator with XRE-family HTH domain
MTIGERIKERRIQKGMTLEELGNKVGVGKSTVRKWETGEISNIKTDKIEKLSEALNLSPITLMGLESNNSEEQKQFDKLLNAIKQSPENFHCIAELCKKERIKHGYSEKYVAENCNIPLKTYLEFENSITIIESNSLLSIFTLLDIKKEFVWGFLAGINENNEDYITTTLLSFPPQDRLLLKKLIKQISKLNSNQLKLLISELEK